MSEAKELAKVPAKENALQVFQASNGLDPYLAKIREEIDGFIPDITTTKGRQAIASIAHSVARSKTALDNIGKELVAELKDVPKKIDAERKRMRDLLDAWKDEVRKPLDDWQAAEDARIDKLQNGIDWFNLRATENADLDATELKASIADVERIVVGEKWEEFEAEAHRAKAKAIESLSAALAKREAYDAEQAELAKLREEKEARDKKDNEDRIAREAAEKATREAEEKAQRERDAQQQKARDDQAAAEKRESDLKLQAAESERRAEQAKREQVEAEQKAEQDRLAAIEREKQAVEQARLDEQSRQQAAADEIIRQQKARQADVAHKSRILGEAKQAFIGMNISEELAKAIVLKIARGEVPNIVINF
jgi:colicin import membrane protein